MAGNNVFIVITLSKVLFPLANISLFLHSINNNIGWKHQVAYWQAYIFFNTSVLLAHCSHSSQTLPWYVCI